MKLTRTFAFLIAVFAITTSKASCLACWELRKVQITLNNGEIIAGFVKWNEVWLSSISEGKKWLNKFPESLLYYYGNLTYDFKIVVAKDIVVVKNDSIQELSATTHENLLRFDHSEIKSIIELADSSKKYEGAGEIPTFSKDDFDKLKTNPYAMLLIEESVANVYLLSYNPYITGKQLEFYKNNYGDKIDELHDKGVITVIISFD